MNRFKKGIQILSLIGVLMMGYVEVSRARLSGKKDKDGYPIPCWCVTSSKKALKQWNAKKAKWLRVKKLQNELNKQKDPNLDALGAKNARKDSDRERVNP